MRNTLRITGAASLVIISVLSVYMFSGTAAAPPVFTVLNPELPNRVVERAPVIPRLDTVDGKTIWFVTENWGDVKSNVVLFEELQKWFAKNHPTTKLVYKVKTGSFMSEDPELWKQLVANADAAILGVAG